MGISTVRIKSRTHSHGLLHADVDPSQSKDLSIFQGQKQQIKNVGHVCPSVYLRPSETGTSRESLKLFVTSEINKNTDTWNDNEIATKFFERIDDNPPDSIPAYYFYDSQLRCKGPWEITFTKRSLPGQKLSHLRKAGT